MSDLLAVDESNFKQVVLESKIPVLVDFWATWCKPCQMVAPLLDALSKEYAGKMAFAKVDVDKNNKIASNYGVMSIPTMIIFKSGKPEKNIVGFKPKDQLKREFDALLG